MVGEGQAIGSVESALRYAMLEVTVPRLAVIPIAVVLVPRTAARPATLILTSDGFAEVQVTDDVMVCVLALL
jgi:hypothetical protein